MFTMIVSGKFLWLVMRKLLWKICKWSFFFLVLLAIIGVGAIILPTFTPAREGCYWTNAFLITHYPQPILYGTKKEHLCICKEFAMSRSKIQFQKGLSERQFRADYGTEEQCRAVLLAWRWPKGFVCPRCGGVRCCDIKTRRLIQCTACRHQVSLTAGTIFHATKLPLVVWFQAIYLVTQTKKGISSLELGRRLGVTQTTAWKVQQKLAQVMLDREAAKPVGGPDKRVEMDDAYLGGARRGGKRGRGAAGKTPFVVVVETTIEGHPLRLKLNAVKGFRKVEIKSPACSACAPWSPVPP